MEGPSAVGRVSLFWCVNRTNAWPSHFCDVLERPILAILCRTCDRGSGGMASDRDRASRDQIPRGTTRTSRRGSMLSELRFLVTCMNIPISRAHKIAVGLPNLVERDLDQETEESLPRLKHRGSRFLTYTCFVHGGIFGIAMMRHKVAYSNPRSLPSLPSASAMESLHSASHTVSRYATSDQQGTDVAWRDPTSGRSKPFYHEAEFKSTATDQGSLNRRGSTGGSPSQNTGQQIAVTGRMRVPRDKPRSRPFS
jgi:hypothetical protein